MNSSSASSHNFHQQGDNSPDASPWFEQFKHSAEGSPASQSNPSPALSVRLPDASHASNSGESTPNRGRVSQGSDSSLQNILADHSAGLLPQLSINTAHLHQVKTQLDAMAAATSVLRPAKKTVKHMKKKVADINAKVTAGIQSYDQMNAMLDTITKRLPDTQVLDRKIAAMEEKMVELQSRVDKITTNPQYRQEAEILCQQPGTCKANPQIDTQEEQPLDLSPKTTTRGNQAKRMRASSASSTSHQRKVAFEDGTKRPRAKPNKPKRTAPPRSSNRRMVAIKKPCNTRDDLTSDSFEDFDLTKHKVTASQAAPRLKAHEALLLKIKNQEAASPEVSFTESDPNSID